MFPHISWLISPFCPFLFNGSLICLASSHHLICSSTLLFRRIGSIGYFASSHFMLRSSHMLFRRADSLHSCALPSYWFALNACCSHRFWLIRILCCSSSMA